MDRLAIVVPTLDEATQLSTLVPTLREAADEVVVSDGGSRDTTLDVARTHGATVVTGLPGRGPQINRGVTATTADAVAVVHADTTLPNHARKAILGALAAGSVGGGFEVVFDSDRRLFRVAARAINLRTRLSRVPLGDQVQFFGRDAFEALGGYREWPILEDLDFARRLRRHGSIAILRPPVVTSARRYERLGFVRAVATNWTIWTLHLLGVSPERLSKIY